MQESKSLHYILGISLVMIAIFAVGSLVMINSQAVDFNANATTLINNATPQVVTTARVSDSVYGAENYTATSGLITGLNAGTTKPLHINGVFSDANGWADISSVTAVFYRSGVTNGSACTAGNNDCYRIATGACNPIQNGASATEVKYDCLVDLQYYADSTITGGEFPTDTWKIAVVATDVSAAASTTDTGSVVDHEVSLLGALAISGTTIDYGTRTNGVPTLSTTNVDSFSVSQAGNDQIDARLSYSGDFTCTHGTMAGSAQAYSLTDIDHSAATGLTSSATTLMAAGSATLLPYRHGANPTASIFWNIAVPSAGSPTGTCTATNVVGSLAH